MCVGLCLSVIGATVDEEWTNKHIHIHTHANMPQHTQTERYTDRSFARPCTVLASARGSMPRKRAGRRRINA